MEEEGQNPAKRLKMESDSREHSLNSCETHVRSAGKPVAVLAEKYTRSVETVSIYVADLQNPKLASKCIRELRESFPLEDLQHLKRVRRSFCEEKGEILQILIAKKSAEDEQNNEIAIHDIKELGQLYVIQVPKYQPLTRKQFNEASNLWPTSFHEDKYIANMISGDLFNDTDIQDINRYMSVAIEEAKRGKKDGMIPVGAVVVDPTTGKTIAIAHDLRRYGNPLHHAIMVVIDLVAQHQTGGAWGLGYEQKDGTFVLHDSATELSHNSANKGSVLRDSIEQKRVTGLLCDSYEKTTGMSDQSEKSGPYLCTGYDLYVTNEPCVMCAMALVHSRIRRVFYGRKDLVIGALGSKYSIHVQEGLNHHYEVFTGILQEECQQLMEFSG